MKRLFLPIFVVLSIFAIAGEAPRHFSFTGQSLPEGFEFGTTYSHEKPFYFSIPLAEGNYNVTATLGDPSEACVTTIKAESRRLMLERIRTAPGQILTRTFTVNIRNFHLPPPPQNAPGGDQVRLNDREQGALHWDDKLTLEINDTHPCLAELSVEAVDVPTVFIAGDSTVTDQPRETYASWGQMLPRFFKPGVAVANHAESGETLKSFLTGLRLDKILSQMKKGDYLFIQFGHNDMKENWPQTYVEAFTTYKQYLKTYIAEARRRGATPVLVTSVQRRNFDENGKIRNTLGDYPEAVRQTAKEENVALIDLNAMSMAFYEALGPAKAPLAFAGNGRDATHHDPYGAYELAKCVVEGIKSNHLDLGKFLVDDVPPFDPAHPDPPEDWSLPPSPMVATRPPRGDAAPPPAAPQASGEVRPPLPEPANPKLPTLFLIGDSTVRNGSGDGGNGQWGWGEPLVDYFDTAKINVVNRALGGRSSRTYLTQGLWEQVLAMLKPGDFVIMQFGHNDEGALDDQARARGTLPGVGDDTKEIDNPITKQHEVVHSFGWYIKRFVADAKTKGATPLVCSLIPRKIWKAGKIVRNADTYAGWARQIADSEHVGFIDLNEIIARRYDALGEAAIEPLFADPHTHTSRAGAELNAECVISGLKALPNNPLARYLLPKAQPIPPFVP